MVLQPFNVQALSDPGFSAAAQLIGTGIANGAEGIRQRGVNRNLMLRQLLQNAADEEKSKLAYQAEMQKSQLEAPGKLLNQAKTSKELAQLSQAAHSPGELVDALNATGDQMTSSAIMKLLGGQQPVAAAPQPGLLDKAVGGTAAGLLRKAGGGIKNLFNGDESEAVPQMGESELLEDINAPKSKQTESGAYIGGASVSEPAPYISKYSQSPAGRQITAETSKKEADARVSGFSAREKELQDFPDEFLGKNIETERAASGKYPMAKDITGAEMDAPMTPRLRGLRHSYATAKQESRDKLDEKVENSVTQLDAIKDLTEASVRLRQSGWWDKAYRSGMMDDGPLGKVFRLQATMADTIPPSVIADMQLYNNSRAAAMAKVASLQGKQGISNKDVEGIIKTIGDSSMPTEQFLSTVSRNLGDMYGTALIDAAKSGVNYNILNGQYKQLTGGNPFNIEEINPSEASRNAIYTRYKSLLSKGLGATGAGPTMHSTTPSQGAAQESALQRYKRLKGGV